MMRKSILYETIIRELKSNNLLKSYFDNKDLKNVTDINQKYMVFVYKHSQ